MRKIKDIKELTPGTKVVLFQENVPTFLEFLMIHPHNPEYVLMLDNLSQNATKHYIPNIIGSDTILQYFLYDNIDEVTAMRIKMLKAYIDRLEQRLNNAKEYDHTR